MLGYGDKVISEYFKSAESSPKEGLPDQRRAKKRKAEEALVSDQ